MRYDQQQHVFLAFKTKTTKTSAATIDDHFEENNYHYNKNGDSKNNTTVDLQRNIDSSSRIHIDTVRCCLRGDINELDGCEDVVLSRRILRLGY
jgi:hypothetical protein